jgi:hypothetical protein
MFVLAFRFSGWEVIFFWEDFQEIECFMLWKWVNDSEHREGTLNDLEGRSY